MEKDNQLFLTVLKEEVNSQRAAQLAKLLNLELIEVGQ